MEHDQKRKTTLPSTKGRVRSTVYPSEREVLLARLLVRLCDHFWTEEEFYADKETHDLYNQVKPLAEWVLRGNVARETNR